MADSIFLFRRNTAEIPPERFVEMGGFLGIKGKTLDTDEASFLRNDTRAIAYGRGCAKFAGLFFFVDGAVSWGEVVESVLPEERAQDWGRGFLEKYELLPKQSQDENVKVAVQLDAIQNEGLVFDGRERRPVKTSTELLSKIEINEIPVVGPRGKVRMSFKSEGQPVMIHVGLWESLSVYEERELVREHDVARAVQERLTDRSDCRAKDFDLREIRLVYFADEYRGGPDLLVPVYLVEVEHRSPRYTGRLPIQGPRQVIPLPAFR